MEEAVTDEFLRRAIHTLRSELPEERQKAFDEWASTGRPLQEQLDELTADAMRRYVEPDFLKPRPPEVKDILGLLKGRKG